MLTYFYTPSYRNQRLRLALRWTTPLAAAQAKKSNATRVLHFCSLFPYLQRKHDEYSFLLNCLLKMKIYANIFLYSFISQSKIAFGVALDYATSSRTSQEVQRNAGVSRIVIPNNSTTYNLSTASLASGMYFIQTNHKTLVNLSSKLIIQH